MASREEFSDSQEMMQRDFRRDQDKTTGIV